MSKVLSLRLRDDQVARLDRAAREMERTPADVAALFVEHALREREFAWIEFRDTVVGRQAFIKGTRLKVWMLISMLRSFENDPKALAAALEIPDVYVLAAIEYAKAFPDEIEGSIADNNRSADELRRMIPNLQVITIDADPA
jgi:uncharacterized protein (DUF433 family)